MPKRPRITDDDPDEKKRATSAPLPPSTRQRSTRLSQLNSPQEKTQVAATVPTVVPSSSGLTDSLDPGNNHGSSSEKNLSGAALVHEVLKMAKNRDRAELMILELMEEYSFSFPYLKELLRGKLSTSRRSWD